MVVLKSTAEKIASLAAAYCNASVCVYGPDGMLIASEPEQKTGACSHEAADCIRSGRQIVLDERLCSFRKHLRQGVLIPVRYNGAVVFAVGLYGDQQDISSKESLLSAFLSFAAKSMILEGGGPRCFEIRESLVNALLDPETKQESLKRSAFLSGYNADIPRFCIIASPASRKEGFDENERKKIYDFLFDHQPDVNMLLAAFTDPSRLALFMPLADSAKPVSRSSIKCLHGKLENFTLSNFRTPLRFSLSSLDIGSFKDCAQSYDQAGRTDLLRSRCKSGVFYYDEQGLQMVLSYIPEEARRTYCRSVIKHPEDPKGFLDETLSGTLRCFLQNDLNVSKTAKALFLHRNTLLYRLQKVQDITGKNPRSFMDSIELGLTMELSGNGFLP